MCQLVWFVYLELGFSPQLNCSSYPDSQQYLWNLVATLISWILSPKEWEIEPKRPYLFLPHCISYFGPKWLEVQDPFQSTANFSVSRSQLINYIITTPGFLTCGFTHIAGWDVLLLTRICSGHKLCSAVSWKWDKSRTEGWGQELRQAGRKTDLLGSIRRAVVASFSGLVGC